MDTTHTTANKRYTARRQAHDNGRARRAYLDTYARQTRSAVSQPQEEVQVQPEVLTPATTVDLQQAISPQTTLSAPTSIITQDSFSNSFDIESQPPVTGETFSYVSRPEPTTQLEPVQAETPSYINSITRPKHLLSEMVMPRASKTTQLSKSVIEDVDEPRVIAEPVQVQAPTITEELTRPELESSDEARMEANLSALYGGSLTSQLTNETKSASASHVRTIIASALACGILSVGMFAFIGKVDSQSVVAQPINNPVIEVQVPNSQAPVGAPVATPKTNTPIPRDPSQPARIVISSIGVNARVETLDLTSDGLIDVPKSYGLVGWYDRSVLPGKPGPSILVGHYTGGYGGVFDKLKNLKNGDLITVTNGRGESVTYKVTALNAYDKDKVPMADLVKASDNSRLEIITCTGVWQGHNYNQRLVVTAEIVQ